MTRKTNTMLIGLLGTILMGLATEHLINGEGWGGSSNYDSTRFIQY